MSKTTLDQLLEAVTDMDDLAQSAFIHGSKILVVHHDLAAGRSLQHIDAADQG